MSTQREIKSLADPIVYIDGRRWKILPNTFKAELPGEVNTRAVSAGGGSHDVVHGYDVEQSWCKVSFEVANTEENVDLVQDYKARAKTIELSTLKAIESAVNLNYDRAVMANKNEISFESEGSIPVEFNARYASI